MVRLFLPPIPISSSSYNPLGTGAVYSFDPVGSYEREACRAAGAAQSLVQPFLDNQASLFLSSPALLFRSRSHLFSNTSPSPFGMCAHTRFTEFHPNLYRLAKPPSKTLTRCIPFIDILQESGSGSRDDTPSTSIAAQRVIYCDRFVHKCNRAAYRSKSIPPTSLSAQPYSPIQSGW